jgi:hypothetical protein
LLFRIQSFQFGSYLKKGNWFTSLDSGLSLIAFPSTIANALSNQMPVEWDNELQLWMIDCDQAQSLDDLVFGANGTEIRVPATGYIVDVRLLRVLDVLKVCKKFLDPGPKQQMRRCF